MGTTSNGEISPPKRLAIHTVPCARPRSTTGNQREIADELLGYAPASPAPNAKRTASSEKKLETTPVRLVNTDHHATMRVSTLRAPIRSAIAPLGISNAAYDKVNSPTTQPHCSGLRFNSACIRGPATEMQTRSRYVM